MRRAAYSARLMLICLGLGLGTARAAVEVFPLQDVRPGMRGVAVTVLEGTEPDSFAVEIVGVLDRTSPGRHVILVRALDERIIRTGIAQGMSGSPIYLDGRLLGALAFAYTGATEPIGGATPFEEMQTSLGGVLTAGATTGERRHAGATQGDLAPFPEWRERWAAGEIGAAGAMATAATPLPDGLQPLALPLSLGGVGASIAGADPFWQRLPVALQPMMAASGGAAGAAAAGGSLRAGDAFAIDLISGDMDASAIGTVTWTDGVHIMALGHGFLALAPLDVPVSRALIHTVIPTRGVSFKVGSALDEVGSLVMDRENGVAAVLGRTAPRVPFELRLQIPDGPATDQTFHFDVARHEILTPALLELAARTAISEQGFALGASMVGSRITVRLDDGRTLTRDDLFRTLNPGQTVGEVLAPVAYLAATDLAPFSVQSVSLDLRLESGIRAADVVEVSVPRRTFAPGDTFSARIRLRRHLADQADLEVRRVTMRVPASFSGDRLMVMAGAPLAFYEWDQERAPDKYTPRDFEQFLTLLSEYPSEENLIVRLFAPSRGVVHRNRELPSLPLSKWHALVESTSGDRTRAVAGMILDETRVATGEVIVGGAYVSLDVRR
jgi:hypothetical protein